MNKLRQQIDNPTITSRYKLLLSVYQKSVKKRQCSLNDKRLERADNISKESWRIINERRLGDSGGRRFTGVGILAQDGSIVDDLQTMSNLFNNYFSDIIKQNAKPCNNYRLSVTDSNMFLLPTDPQEIYSLLHKTTKKMAAGIDDILGSVLKKVRDRISEPLSRLVNESFVRGQFPQSLKKSKCIPVFKNKGSRSNVSNYRPISIQSQVAKVFEAAFAVRLVNYLERFKLLNEFQH